MGETVTTETKLLEVDATLHSLLKWAALQKAVPMKACTSEAISDWLTKQKPVKAQKSAKKTSFGLT